MNRLLALLLAIMVTGPTAGAERPPQQPEELPPLPPPELQHEPPVEQGPLLVAPQQAEKPGQPPEFFRARRAALAARKAAQLQRMREVRAARAAAEQQAYQDWHERYLADTPVRVEYYRALARAYEADAALAYRAPYYYSAGPIVVVPVVVPAYVPVYNGTIYGTVYWAW